MIWIYRVLFLPIFIFAAPYYAYRMFKRGGYGKDFMHRLGWMGKIPKKKPGSKRIWIQAVSVGEVRAIEPLVEYYNQHTDTEIVITTTTSTAYRILLEHFQHRVTKVGIFPLDFWIFSKLAWFRLKPDLAILMESELWPEHLHQANKRKVPVILVNARLSDRSFRRYRCLQPISGWIVRSPNHILAASELDAERFVRLGARAENVVSCGNIKFDVNIEPMLDTAAIQELKQEMGLHSAFADPAAAESNPPLTLLGSSTWPGEESMLLKVLETALEAGLNFRLLIVPRHAERRGELESLLSKQRRAWHLRSRGFAPGPVRIYVADTTGELTMLSQLADLAFIGKSLPPNNGGQTPIEAAALGLPIVYGPKMSNFRLVAKSLEAAGAAVVAKNEQEAIRKIVELLQKPKMRAQMAAAAKEWHGKNRGALERVYEICAEYL